MLDGIIRIVGGKEQVPVVGGSLFEHRRKPAHLDDAHDSQRHGNDDQQYHLEYIGISHRFQSSGDGKKCGYQNQDNHRKPQRQRKDLTYQNPSGE